VRPCIASPVVVQTHHMRDTFVTPSDKAVLEELLGRAKRDVDVALKEVDSARQRYSQSVERLGHLQALLELERSDSERAEEARAGLDGNATSVDRQAVDVAAALLAERGDPVHYREIYSELEKRGVQIKGASPANTLLTRMLRDGRFKPSGPRGCYVLDTAEEHHHFRSEAHTGR
jgi:hypothetical protein